MGKVKMVDAKAFVKHQNGLVILELDRGDDYDHWALMSSGAARALARLLTLAAERADSFNLRKARP